MANETPSRRDEWTRRHFLRIGLSAAASVPVVLARCGETPSTVVDSDAGGDAIETAPDATPPEPIWDPTSLGEDDATFPLGVHVGAVRWDSGLIAGFAEDGAPKRLRVWRLVSSEDHQATEIVVDEDLTPTDGYFKAAIEGLEAATWYGVALFGVEGDTLTGRSAIATFTTAWAPGSLAPVTFAATACTKYVNMPYESLLQTSQHPYDAFLQLGDMGYYDEASNREEYRALWRDTLRDPGYQAVMRRGAYYATLDDHEIANNAVRADMDPEHYDAGRDAWFEHLAVPRDGQRFWDSYRWGDSVELFVLDCRTERQPETRLTDDAIYISKEQLAWFTEALQSSPCHFKVIMTSVPISNLPELWGAGSDWWKGYASQWQVVLDIIATVDNVWCVAGDMHVGTVHRLDREGPLRRYWEVMVGPGAPQFGNPIPGLAQLQPELAEDYLPSDQFLFADAGR
ncbi:MAG: alkaline phosphatase D family protein, partial [Myxococcota bacterium]|nr:alkaline phosphatase D family protein [Myxococcota bacterium]